MPDYVAAPHIAYNWTIVVYFFLGGLGAGAFLLSVAANYWKPEFKPVARTASILAPIAVMVGAFFLWIDLGMPFRAWRLMLSFNPTSALSWGVWFLNIFLALSVIYIWLSLKGQEGKAKRVAYAAVPFAVLVAAYTGVLLAQSPGRALWHSALLPVLFVNGALISGVAAVILLSAGRVGGELLAGLGKVVAWLVLLELGLVVVELVALLNGGAEGVEVAKALLSGEFSALFLGVQIVLGAVVPSLILLRGKINPAALAVASALVLVGVFTMRYIVVIAGQAIG
jgi:formate-dependent nitrite reductase membrane component NrfD